MKYPKLRGLCKKCELGCFRLENPEFTGTMNCKHTDATMTKEEILEELRKENEV